jgi:FKBP12-rapamycin complex-associated protein
MITQGPTTARESSFAQVFGRDLHEAYEACRRYRMYGDTTELDNAWDIYYGVRPSFILNSSEYTYTLYRFSGR